MCFPASPHRHTYRRQLCLLVPARQAKRKDGVARRGQRKALALPADQRLSDLLFKLPQMLAYARLGHVQTVRGPGEMPGLAKRGEGL